MAPTNPQKSGLPWIPPVQAAMERLHKRPYLQRQPTKIRTMTAQEVSCLPFP